MTFLKMPTKRIFIQNLRVLYRFAYLVYGQIGIRRSKGTSYKENLSANSSNIEKSSILLKVLKIYGYTQITVCSTDTHLLHPQLKSDTLI